MTSSLRLTKARTFLRLPVALGLACAGLLLAARSADAADTPDPAPAFWQWAKTPPMGWNSYDAFGASVTEDEVMANARYMKEKLRAHGWQYVVVDYRWYDADAAKTNEKTSGAPLTTDGYGRLLPALARFPSAEGGQGFKPLADKVHALGLKFGIHLMRGIPRQAVNANVPIEGSSFRAANAANTSSKCEWCVDMFGVRGDTQAGQAYYDSIFRLYAAWGVDFVKVDDLSKPYHADEVAAVRKAIDQCGRPMVFSTSPGETPVAEAVHVSTRANLWRVSGDFWDRWGDLDHAFDLAAVWQGTGGPGRWPDSDMIPLGHLGIRSLYGDRQTRFTRDEQITLLSLWSLGPSPLMLGMNLPDTDPWTLAALTNDEVLAINQDRLGSPAKRLPRKKDAGEVWVRELADGSKAVGLFNRGGAETRVTLNWGDAGFAGALTVRDVWQHKDLGSFENQLVLPVPSHGAVLLALKGAGGTRKAMVGRYAAPGDVTVTISLRGEDGLTATLSDGTSYELTPKQGTIFNITSLDGTAEFRRNADGVYNEVVGSLSDGTYTATRIP